MVMGTDYVDLCILNCTIGRDINVKAPYIRWLVQSLYGVMSLHFKVC